MGIDDFWKSVSQKLGIAWNGVQHAPKKFEENGQIDKFIYLLVSESHVLKYKKKIQQTWHIT